jgi:hypothetical protein
LAGAERALGRIPCSEGDSKVDDEKTFQDSRILECGHCGNRTPHSKVWEYEHLQLYEKLDDRDCLEPYTWVGYACGTCGGLNIYGDFFQMHEDPGLMRTRLHPRASLLLPPTHMVSPSYPIPGRILTLYEEIWPLRHRAPAAFVGQARRLLEFVCEDQNASGRTLFDKLTHLVSQGILPGYFKNITDLLRVVGNMGAHASATDLSIWDAELIDDFFRSVVEYLYVAPAKIKRMQERLSPRAGVP